MRKLFMLALGLALAATAWGAADSFVRGSVVLDFVLPQMEMPRANDWAKNIDFTELVAHHEGELGTIKPGFGYGLGYGVSLGPYFRFDASVSTIKSEHKATFTGVDPDTNVQYNRGLTFTTHIVPMRFDGTFVAPGFFNDRFKPEFGLGVVTYIVRYNTDQTRTTTPPGEPADVRTGQAWARDVCFGPEAKAGLGITLFDGFTVEAALTYSTAEATFDQWTRYSDIPLNGPGSEDFTGWAVWVGPRYYF